MASIEHCIHNFVVTELLYGESDSVAADENLLISGKVDSIGMMRLVAFIDDTYGFQVPPEDVIIENFMSISKITEYIDRNIPK